MNGQGHRVHQNLGSQSYGAARSGRATHSAPTGPRSDSPSAGGRVLFTRDANGNTVRSELTVSRLNSNTPGNPIVPRAPASRQSHPASNRAIQPATASRQGHTSNTGSSNASYPSSRPYSSSSAAYSKNRRRPRGKRPVTGETVEEMIQSKINAFIEAIESGSLSDEAILEMPLVNNNPKLYRLKVRTLDDASKSSRLPNEDFYANESGYGIVFHATRKALINKAFSAVGRSLTFRETTYLDFNKLVGNAVQALKDAEDCTPEVRTAYIKDGKEDMLDKAIEISTTKIKTTSEDDGKEDMLKQATQAAIKQLSRTSDDEEISGGQESSTLDLSTTHADDTVLTTAEDGNSAEGETSNESNTDITGPTLPTTGVIRLCLSNYMGVDAFQSEEVSLPLPAGLEGELVLRATRPNQELPQHLRGPSHYLAALSEVAFVLSGFANVDGSDDQHAAQAEDDLEMGDDVSETSSL